MKQIYVPYWEWEDWKNGMWRKLPKSEEPAMLKTAIEFTGDWKRYGAAMSEVIVVWPRTMLNTLTNVSVNRRAFLGHCAAQYKINCPEYITRQAWGLLTEQQRREADAVAEKNIKQYERKHIQIHTAMGKQMLLEGIAR